MSKYLSIKQIVMDELPELRRKEFEEQMLAAKDDVEKQFRIVTEAASFKQLKDEYQETKRLDPIIAILRNLADMLSPMDRQGSNIAADEEHPAQAKEHVARGYRAEVVSKIESGGEDASEAERLVRSMARNMVYRNCIILAAEILEEIASGGYRARRESTFRRMHRKKDVLERRRISEKSGLTVGKFVLDENEMSGRSESSILEDLYPRKKAPLKKTQRKTAFGKIAKNPV